MIILIHFDFNPLDRYGLPLNPFIYEARCKFMAAMLLRQYYNEKRGIVIPTKEEWHGINMKERNDEL